MWKLLGQHLPHFRWKLSEIRNLNSYSRKKSKEGFFLLKKTFPKFLRQSDGKSMRSKVFCWITDLRGFRTSWLNGSLKQIRPFLDQNSTLPKNIQRLQAKTVSYQGALEGVWHNLEESCPCWDTPLVLAGLPCTKRSANKLILSDQKCSDVHKNCKGQERSVWHCSRALLWASSMKSQCEAFLKVFQLFEGCNVLPAPCGEPLQFSMHANC